MTMWASWGREWELFDKVSFDGINKIIFVHPEVTTFDIRGDLYTSWIDWLTINDNIKFSPVMRITGLDPIGGGVFTGDVYFLINGWRLSVNLQKVKVNGVLFSDDYETAFYTNEMVAQYPVSVSSLVTTVASGGGGGGATASQIRQEMDNNSSKLLQIKSLLDSLVIPTSSQNADAVWNRPITTMTDKATIGGYISKVLLSIPKFLGLK